MADEVFLNLANEIEAQGVGRKVAADMFGLALRTYQRKVQRLGDNIASRERSLWETVLEYVRARGRVFKGEVVAEFQREGEADVIVVLTDLVASGLLFSSGRGEAAIYCVTSDADRRAITEGKISRAPLPSFGRPSIGGPEPCKETRPPCERYETAPSIPQNFPRLLAQADRLSTRSMH